MKVKAIVLAALVALPQILAPAPVLAQDANSRPGCMNQWLFNGVWRVRITKVEPIMDGAKQTGWQVTQSWRNGTSRELAPADSAMKPEQLTLSGQTLTAEGHRQEGLSFNTLAPSGQFTYTQTFFGPNMSVDPNDKPKALDVSFDNAVVSQSNKPHFSSNKYNYHYDLSCVASGAAAQAEGGSSQLAATDGCMNQWMSNGIWKMRVIKVGPNPPDATPANQAGWQVTQEWVNITNRKLFPSGLSDPGQHVAPSNVSDEFLATKSGNNASTFNMVGGFSIGSRNIPFPPGSSYKFVQNINWSPFDATDTPIRLLVTFDVATQNKLPNVPHYRKPGNFRINLTCGSGALTAQEQQQPATQSQGQPATQPQAQTAAAAAPASTASGGRNVDPCAMLSAPSVASALGVGVQSLGAAQHPSANECAWAVASHAGAPAQNVVLVMQPVQAAATCHGFGCLGAVTSVLGMHGVPGVPGVPGQFADAFNDAQLISGLGDKASWKDGKLTVLRADMAFQLFVHGSGSSTLNASEALARDVLYRYANP